jgi:hypothetical protein
MHGNPEAVAPIEWLKCCSREELQQFSRVPNSLAQTSKCLRR